MILIGGNVCLFMLRERRTGSLWISDKIPLDSPKYLSRVVSFLTVSFHDAIFREYNLDISWKVGELPSPYRRNYDSDFMATDCTLPLYMLKPLYAASIGKYLPPDVIKVINRGFSCSLVDVLLEGFNFDFQGITAVYPRI